MRNRQEELELAELRSKQESLESLRDVLGDEAVARAQAEQNWIYRVSIT